jgi:hypothetical protein
MKTFRLSRLAIATCALALVIATLAPAPTARAHSSQNSGWSDSHSSGNQQHQCRRNAKWKKHRRPRWERPAADAGPDQAASSGQTVTLDGSRSRDADGDELRYYWELVERPKRSRARLDDRRTVRPTLDIDVNGKYVAALVVKSCDGLSRPDFVVVRASGNLAPVANAGPERTVFVGDSVTLDGSASSDANGDALRFAWQIVSAPAGSQTTLSDVAAVRPVLSPDLRGDYVVQLTVNDGRLASAPDTVTIHTAPTNSAPIANAGPDQSSRIGFTVALDASASTDPDRDALSFEWTFVTRPDGSNTDLQGANSAQASFFVDVEGEYVAEVSVCDARGACSEPDAVVVAAAGNSVPLAVPGANQEVDAGDTVQLDGSGSSDADGDPLSFAWSLTAVPPGSAATLSDASGLAPTFLADVAGDYVVQLIVDDVRAASAPATLLVTARPAANTDPVANDDAAETMEEAPVTIAVLDNDSDADGDALTIESVSQPEDGSGEVTIEGNAVRFTPAEDFAGESAFTYSATDARGGVMTATVLVTVVGINEPPTAQNDSAVTEVNQPVLLFVLANDTDPDGDRLAIVSFTQPVGGRVQQDDTRLFFTPSNNFVATTTFSYTATDGEFQTTATVTVTVQR